MNSFGHYFRVNTFGESHGAAIGCVIDGMPAGVAFDEVLLRDELAKRRPGKNRFSTQRNEQDEPEVLSGVFEGMTTGTPIAVLIRNTNQKSTDYADVKSLFRPGHADFGYQVKYGLRDYRGGGRSSARETAARVAAGAFAKMLLREIGIDIKSGVFQIGTIKTDTEDFAFAEQSDIFALDSTCEEMMKQCIDDARNMHDSVGGAVKICIRNVPAGLGEPLYARMDSELAGAMVGVNGVKAVEIGAGIAASSMYGSQNNDQREGDIFLSNHAGGIVGGITTGQDITVRVYFKPTPSIFKPQKTVDESGETHIMNLKGRHDPCIAPRGCVVSASMCALVCADMLLANMSCKIDSIARFYRTFS